MLSLYTVMGMVSMTANMRASGSFNKRSVPILEPDMLNLPSRRVPLGMAIPSARALRKSMFPTSVSSVMSPPRFSVSVRWVNSPLAKSSNAPGSSALRVVNLSWLRSPSTPVRMRKGSAGYFCTKCSSIPPTKRMMSCLPISAINRADNRPLLFISNTSQSMDAFNSKSESEVVRRKEGIRSDFWLESNRPWVDRSSSPERSFSTNRLIMAFMSRPS